MKKILFVTSALGVGGMERVLVDISNALVERDYDVTILTYEEMPEKNWLADLDGRVNFIYKAHRIFPILSQIPYIHRYYNVKKKNWETRASAKTLYKYYVGTKIKYDVEIAFCRGPAVKIISGSTNKRSKKITWVHNDYRYVDQKTITKFFGSMEKTKEAYKHFDKIAAVSDEAKRIFIDIFGYKEKLLTIYNLLDLDSISKKMSLPCPVEKTGFTFITVARLIEAKGHMFLLKAAKRLNDEGFKFNVWLVGSGGGGQCEVELKKYAKENNLDNVTFFGRQTNPYCFMKQADVYFCSSWIEGFSIAVAEAMACGLPVISTRCTGPTEILDNGKYGILINYDENEVYEAMKYALLNPKKLLLYKEKSLKRSKDFSEEKIIKQITDLFE